MRFFIVALMLLGLMTGGFMRAAECDDLIAPTDCCTSQHTSQKDHCPDDHQHHSTCCHVTPLFVANMENEFPPRAFVEHQANFRPQNDCIPEGPFLSSEKPPII